MRRLLWLLAAMPTIANAAVWVPVAQSSVGAVVQMDAETIRVDGHHIQAWMRSDLSRVRNQPANSRVGLFDVYCDQKQIRMLSDTAYNKEGGVIAQSNEPTALEAPPPDSVLETIMNFTCDYTRIKGVMDTEHPLAQ